MKVFAGGLGTETNTFSPIPTGLADYDIIRDEERLGSVIFSSTLLEHRRLAQERGWDFEFGMFAFAQPAGITVRQVYEDLRDELLARLQAALPVDMVLLTMHGAMVAEGYDDCETDIVHRVREIVGPQVKIGVEFDLHSELTPQLVADADAIVLFKEYPHIDIDDRARDLFKIIADAAEGKTNPTMGYFDCRMLGTFLTPVEPMRSFVDRMMAREGHDGLLSLSLFHSFPYGDVPSTSVYMLAITDNDPAQATRIAEALGREFFAMRHTVSHNPADMGEVLDKVAALPATGKPIVAADTADNAGGGAPSDSTFVLRELLRRGMRDVGLALMWDPIVVQLAMAAGVGATLQVRLGGKMGVASGDPLDLTVKVKGIVPNMLQHWPQQTGAQVIACGDSVCLECEGIDIIVNSRRTQVFGIDVFTNFGIDLNSKRLLVVKSSQHYYAAYAPIAAQVFYMATPGTLQRPLTRLPYRRVDTHKYPWVDDPFEEEGS